MADRNEAIRAMNEVRRATKEEKRRKDKEKRDKRNADRRKAATPKARATRAAVTGRSTRSTGSRFLFPTTGTGRTDMQTEYDNISNDMPKDWLPANLRANINKMPRPNLRPRGIENPGNHCYLNSILQAFMHMPQFLHWIRGHVVTQNCTPHWEPEDPGTRPDERIYTHGPCICCSMKALVEEYWGPTDPLTRPIRWTSASLEAIKRIAFQNFDTGFSLETEARFVREQQEDAQEALVFLQNVLNDYDTRTDQFDAMFRLCLVPMHTCTDCGKHKEAVVQTDANLLVTFDKQTHNTVASAIHDKFEKYPGPESKCESATCGGANTDKLQVWIIRAAPRILTITLVVFDYQEDTPIKKLHAVEIGEELDLTRYQEVKVVPLKYRLSTVVSHSGNTANAGHYVASVRSQGASPFFNINDHRVLSINPAEFRANPQRPPGVRTMQGFQAYMLTYIMDEAPVERFLGVGARERARLAS
ncbi:ubiquitin carboxyl-terminal hydrolase 2 [Paraphaeosphaeria sporulosa]